MKKPGESSQLLVSWIDLGVAFSGQTLVQPFSGSLSRGQKIAILGVNGSGKSSWIKALLGLLDPTQVRGQVHWQTRWQGLSYVPQSIEVDLQIPLTVREFLAISQCQKTFSLPWPWIQKGLDEKSETLLKPELLSAPLAQLSRGQMQMVMLARAYLQKPEIVFLDEPLTGLDRERRAQILKYIFASTETMMMVAHDHDWDCFGFTHVLHLAPKQTAKIQTLIEYKASSKKDNSAVEPL